MGQLSTLPRGTCGTLKYQRNGILVLLLLVLALLIRLAGNQQQNNTLRMDHHDTTVAKKSLATLNRNTSIAANVNEAEQTQPPGRNGDEQPTLTIRPDEFCRDPESDQPPPPPPEEFTGCKCTDPTIALPATSHVDEWYQHHHRLVQDVNHALLSSKAWDVVMIGDSLIEHWNGTKLLGKTKAPAMRQMFDSFFSKSTTTSASLQGMALGSSMDKSPNLLWHLQNGLLPDHFHPKVWLILIGTNDLVGTKCSKQSTLQGIMQVAQYLTSQRPKAAILIHGLLSRAQPNSMALGTIWQSIQWINQQLFQTCQQQNQQQQTNHNWYYMDTGDLFLAKSHDKINSRLMGDGIHPRLSGMKLWGPKIVQAVQQIIAHRSHQ